MVGESSSSGPHVQFVTPPDNPAESTSSATQDVPVEGPSVDTDPLDVNATSESPVGPSQGSYWGTPWSRLPSEMVFRFASGGDPVLGDDTPADIELLSAADQDSEGPQVDSEPLVPSPAGGFQFADLPPGAQRGGPSVIPPGRRSRGPQRQLQSSAESRSEIADLYILDKDWSGWYAASNAFGEVWKKIHSEPDQWPAGYKVFDRKLYFREKLCIPEDILRDVLRAHHEWLGHLGNDRLSLEVDRRYELPSGYDLRKVLQNIKRHCLVCQACDRPNWASKGRLAMTPIPERFMASVCLDVFSMPIVEWQGAFYDAFLMCVDRHSGWMIVKPTRKAGLTGEKAAHLLLDSTWGEVGVPTVVTSDQGSQFVSQWWLTMCARLGIRTAFSQSHRPQANGRAEVAGRVLQDILRKLLIVQDINWVEALPSALRIHHDTPDPISRLSPYEIVFGRQRSMGGLPRSTPHECMGASDWLDRMKEVDVQVAAALNAAHSDLQETLNTRRRDRPHYQVGEWVWYIRPRAVGGVKLQSWWQGPFKVVERVGERSYKLRTHQGEVFDAHSDQLKPCVWEEPKSPGVTMRYPPDRTDDSQPPRDE